MPKGEESNKKIIVFFPKKNALIKLVNAKYLGKRRFETTTKLLRKIKNTTVPAMLADVQ